VLTLTKTNKSLLNSKETAQSDFAYMQAQYSEASTAAVARAREASVAEDEAARLKGLLDVGLKQRELVAKGEAKMLREHIKRLQLETGLLKEESRRTQASGVREKASKWDSWQAELKYRAEVEAANGRGENPDDDETTSDEESETDESVLKSEVMAVGERVEGVGRGGGGLASLLSAEPFICEWRMGSASQAGPCGVLVQSREVCFLLSPSLPFALVSVLITFFPMQALHDHILGHVPLATGSSSSPATPALQQRWGETPAGGAC
jgi:hypothetical protein